LKRSAAQYAVLSPLLDQLLDLDEPARASWLAALPRDQQKQRPALARILNLDRAASNRLLKSLEAQLRSSVRGVRELAEHAGDES
jgi:hypothetical protein